MKQKQIILIIGIILLAYGIYSSGMLFSLVGNISGFTTYKLTTTDGSSVIYNGLYTKAITVNGNSYTANVRTGTLNSGVAAVAFYKNGVAIGGTWNLPAPNCPPCTPAYNYIGTTTAVGYSTINSELKGGADCYTNQNSGDPRGPVGSTFCYIDLAVINAGVPTTCIDNGITYNAGAQIHVTGCTVSGSPACSANYYIKECVGNNLWHQITGCYAGTNCQPPGPTTCTNTCPGQSQYPTPDCRCYGVPNPGCTVGATQACQADSQCAGTQTCFFNTQTNTGDWGACAKTDNKCGQTDDYSWLKYVLIAIGGGLILYGVLKK